MKKKFISAILTLTLASQLFAGMLMGVSAEETTTTSDVPLSLPADEIPEDDVLKWGNFDREKQSLGMFNKNKQSLYWFKDANGGYLQTDDIGEGHVGFDFEVDTIIDPGTYKFTGYFRCAEPEDITQIIVMFYYQDGTYYTPSYYYRAYLNGDWLKVEYYVELAQELWSIKIRGGTRTEFIQPYCMDNFSLVPIPAEDFPADPPRNYGDDLGLTYAEYAEKAFIPYAIKYHVTPYDPVKEAEYEVGGIIVNHDSTNFYSYAFQNEYEVQDIIDFALQFEGTHVTDYMINVFGGGTVNYPSAVVQDRLDEYYRTEKWGQTVDFTKSNTEKGMPYINEQLGTDYIGLWHEAFRSIGINPWLSYRMNDVHDLTAAITGTGKPTSHMGDFYYNNPHMFRVKHHDTIGYMDCALDFAYEEVHDMLLAAINDGLNNYDTYGIELDYQREIYLFSIGGEYRGLDILNEFMRKVDDLVKIYEEKYGHEIKIGVRVAPDIQTNYDLGLDVITWAAEDIIDLVIPTGRYESLQYDTPTRLWVSAMKPFDVEVAPCIEEHIRSWSSDTGSLHTFETMTGFAANAFSQGADKVAMYNYFRRGTSFPESEKYTTPVSLYDIHSDRGAWNMFTTIGSYEKLMGTDRRVIMTYTDVKPEWQNEWNAVLPTDIAAGDTKVFRLPVGDVTVDATVTFKMSCTNISSLVTNDTLPTVYVNSKLCEFVGSQTDRSGITSYEMMCFEIPKEAHNDGYMVIEITADQGIWTDHMEITVVPNR